MALHRTLTLADIHQAHSFSYANVGARTGATGLISADIGKLAIQQDNLTLWWLVNHSPVTWKELTGTVPVSGFIQSAAAEVTSDTTTTSTSFVDLLSVTVSTGVGYLLIRAAGSISNSNANKQMKLRVLLDGVAKLGASVICTQLNTAEGFSIALRRAVTAGSHTVKLQWLTTANTAQCRPVTGAVDSETASLLVEEVTA